MNDWFEAEQRAERAHQLCEAHQFTAALAELDAALAVQPDNPDWNAQRGWVLRELGRDDDAIGAFRRAWELAPDESEVALALAVSLTSTGRLASALEVLEQVAQRDASFEAAYCERVHLYARLGRHEDAEQTFYLAQQLNEHCPDCFYYMAMSLASRGEKSRALFCLERTLEIDPGYPGVNRQIARLHEREGDFAAAREYLVRELRLNPGDTGLLAHLGRVALRARRVGEALTRFRSVLELDPGDADAHLGLAHAYMLRRRFDRSLRSVDRAIGLDEGLGEQPNVQLARARALVGLERFEEAVPALAAIVRDDSTHVAANKLLGRCLYETGRPAEAADCFRRRLATHPDDVDCVFRLGLALFRQGRLEDALQQVSTVAERRPRSVQPLVTLALLQSHMGRRSAARGTIGQALRLQPANPALISVAKLIRRGRVRTWVGRVLAGLRSARTKGTATA